MSATAHVTTERHEMTRTTTTTATYELSGVTPRTTLKRIAPEKGATTYELRIEVEDLAPQRNATAEEVAAGVLHVTHPDGSVGPFEVPIGVRLRGFSSPAQTHRELIDRGKRFLAAGVQSTTGQSIPPGELLMLYMRASLGIRAAIRLLGEEV